MNQPVRVFHVGSGERLGCETGRVLAQGEGWKVYEAVLPDGTPALVVDERLLAELVPIEGEDAGAVTVYVFSSDADRLNYAASRGRVTAGRSRVTIRANEPPSPLRLKPPDEASGDETVQRAR